MTSKAHALNAQSAAISTPATKSGEAPMLVICAYGTYVNLSGVEALNTLLEAVQHALCGEDADWTLDCREWTKVEARL